MKPAYREMVRFKEHIDCATRHFMRIVVPLEGAKKIFQRLIGHQPPRLFSERYAIEFLVALGVKEEAQQREMLNRAVVSWGLLLYDRHVLEQEAHSPPPEYFTSLEAAQYLGLGDRFRPRCLLRRLEVARHSNPDRTRWPRARFMYRRTDLDEFVDWWRANQEAVERKLGLRERSIAVRRKRMRQEYVRSLRDGSVSGLFEPPTTACFECGAVVPVEESWSPKFRGGRSGLALCENCFRQWETAGRAREATSDLISPVPLFPKRTAEAPTDDV